MPRHAVTAAVAYVAGSSLLGLLPLQLLLLVSDHDEPAFGASWVAYVSAWSLGWAALIFVAGSLASYWATWTAAVRHGSRLAAWVGLGSGLATYWSSGLAAAYEMGIVGTGVDVHPGEPPAWALAVLMAGLAALFGGAIGLAWCAWFPAWASRRN